MTKLEGTMIDATTTTVATTSPVGNSGDGGVQRKMASNEVKGMLRADPQAQTLTEETLEAEGEAAILGHELSEAEVDPGIGRGCGSGSGGLAPTAIAPSSSSAGIRLRTFEVVVSRVLSSLIRSGTSSPAPKAPMIDVWRMHTPLPSSAPLGRLRSAFLRRTGGNDTVDFVTESSISAADRCRYCRHLHTGIEDDGEESSSGSSSLSRSSQSCCWPFDVLPVGATVRSRHVRLRGESARRKEAQIRSVITCVLDLLPRLRPPAQRRHVPCGEDLDRETVSSPHGDEVDLDSSTCHVEWAADEVELDGNGSVPAHGEGNGRVDDRQQPSTGRLRIVDFCGGSGHLALPLALFLPECDVVVVDLKADSLEILRRRARSLSESCEEQQQQQRERGRGKKKTRPRRPTAHTAPGENGEGGQVDVEAIIPGAIQPSCHRFDGGGGVNVPNLYTYHGDVASFASRHDFDVGVALHACGEATDVVLNACIAVNAAFVLAPCCVGKLNHRRARDPYVFRATAANDPTISYPQSRTFQCRRDDGCGAGLGVTEEEFHELASAADYGHAEDAGTPRNAVRRVAKTLVEWDRLCLAAEASRPRGLRPTRQPPPRTGVGGDEGGIETCDDGGGGGGGGYTVMLTRMDPWDASPKNDILMGCPPPLSSPSEEDSRLGSPLGSPFHEKRKTEHDGGRPKRPNPDEQHLQCQSLTPGEANIARLAAKYRPSSNSSRENGMPKLNDADDAILADTRYPNADVHWAMHHLNVVVDRGENDLPATEESRGSSTAGAKHDGMEWTKDEVERVQRILEDFLSGDEKSDRSEDREGEVLRFPPGEGSRMRKLVHHLAELRGLHHVSRGKQSSKRYVVVSRK